MRRSIQGHLSTIALLGAVCVGTMEARAQSQSASYRLQQSTLSSGGALSSATSYLENGSLGQELTIGASSSPHFVVQSGFWSFAGTSLVPVYLTVHKTLSEPSHVMLQWTGNNPPYGLFRSPDCTEVFSGPLASETSNAYDDVPPSDHLICYNVLATAPGPIAPTAAPSVRAATVARTATDKPSAPRLDRRR